MENKTGLQFSRRKFLAASGLMVAGMATGMPRLVRAQDGAGEHRTLRPMAMTPVGPNDVECSRMGIHGLDFQELDREVALRILERAAELNVTYFDTSPHYGRRQQGELRLGEAFGGRRRGNVVLATGTVLRGGSEAERSLESSLVRLRTDHIDVWKIESIGTERDLEFITAPGGVLEVAHRAVEDGRVGMIAIHGYRSPDVLTAAVERIEGVDIAHFPVNCLDPHYQSFVRGVLPRAREKGLAIVASHDQALDSLQLAFNISKEEARLYTLSQPITTWLPQVRSLEELEACVYLACSYIPLSEDNMEDLLERSENYAGPAFEFYKE